MKILLGLIESICSIFVYGYQNTIYLRSWSWKWKSWMSRKISNSLFCLNLETEQDGSWAKVQMRKLEGKVQGCFGNHWAKRNCLDWGKESIGIIRCLPQLKIKYLSSFRQLISQHSLIHLKCGHGCRPACRTTLIQLKLEKHRGLAFCWMMEWTAIKLSCSTGI